MDLLAKALKSGKKEESKSVIKKVEEFNKALKTKKPRTELELEGDLLGETKENAFELEVGNGVEVTVIEPTLKKKTKRLAVSSTKKVAGTSAKKGKKGRVFAFVGKHGTGKTFACGKFAEKWKKTFYLDTEYKASEILDEQCPDLKYDMKEPIKDKNKKHSQIFKDSSDVHIDVAQVIDETTGKLNNIATVQYIIKNTPLYLKMIKSGKYKNFIIDSCMPIWKYAEKTWLKKKGRDRVTQFEWNEVEAIKQNIILPFVNYCKIYNVNLILTFGITGHYINDTLIGYKEDAKQWLLNIFSYELWFEYDYRKYCLKHPYKSFWTLQDENLDISEYLFDKKFIDESVEHKEFEDFKYETMTSESYRKDVKKREKSSTLTIG